MAEWKPQLSRLGKPRYLAIADAIAEDISNGTLSPSDRLPPQRKLPNGSKSTSPPSLAVTSRRNDAA